MMARDASDFERILSVVAATLIALSCGTNYIYSAWAPQFAERMKLSSTDSNLIGAFGNLGMYATGIPVGYLVDTKGPRLAVVLGAVCLLVGYFPIHKAYTSGPGSMTVTLLCFFSILTGLGSCSAFAAAVKVSAMNWPDHRGTATAFPVSAFGLSAFFFSSLSSIAFPDDTSGFLLVLALGTSALVSVSFFFLRVIHPSAQYSALPGHEDLSRSESSQLHRTKSDDSRHSAGSLPHGPGTENNGAFPKNNHLEASSANVSTFVDEGSEHHDNDVDETSSLMSTSTTSGPGDVPYNELKSKRNGDNSHHVDIRGLSLLPQTEFWQLVSLLGLVTGVGLMTINNIGNDVRALWAHYDDSVKIEFIQQRQMMHVSILSVMSFLGRLSSGVGSDLITNKLGRSRYWCVVVSSCVFSIAQFSALNVENPHYLWIVSGSTGLGYGFLFGVFPALVADAFGVKSFSQNWGCMFLAPVLTGNIFNLVYGSVYDHHSTVQEDGERHCSEGLNCYRSAYYLTFVSSLMSLALGLWCVRKEDVKRLRKSREDVSSREA